jgi:Tfp pilus assembly protein PilP
MRLILTSVLIAVLSTGCSAYRERTEKESIEQMRRDSEARQARLKTTSSLNDKEYETVSDRMGWSRSDARGLPPPPTTEELEKKLKPLIPDSRSTDVFVRFKKASGNGSSFTVGRHRYFFSVSRCTGRTF